MKYKNAVDVLPEHMIDELQKYAGGELIYIPKPKDSHKKWGELSGGRQYLRERNQQIKRRFQKDKDIDRLAEEFCLSQDSIKKIVYKKT